MSYWLHPEADAEFERAAVYYAQHASQAVAQAFVQEFERVLAVLIENPQFGTPTGDGLRKYPFKRFPYTVIYRASETEGPKVYTVAHQSREPGYWRERLGT